jgi:hypothetical protein
VGEGAEYDLSSKTYVYKGSLERENYFIVFGLEEERERQERKLEKKKKPSEIRRKEE